MLGHGRPAGGVGAVRYRGELVACLLDALPQGQVLSTLVNGALPSSHYYESYHYASELGSDEQPADRKPSRHREAP